MKTNIHFWSYLAQFFLEWGMFQIKVLEKIKTHILCSSSSSSSCSWRVRHVSLFLDPQEEVGTSISSSVVLCFFVPLVYTVVLVLVVCLCPSSVHVVATFSGTVLFPLLCSVLQFFCLIHWFFSLSSFIIPSKCLKNFICAASESCSSNPQKEEADRHSICTIFPSCLNA